jgi:hypothetical protein
VLREKSLFSFTLLSLVQGNGGPFKNLTFAGLFKKKERMPAQGAKILIDLWEKY